MDITPPDLTGLECFRLFNSLKLHFTSEKFDFNKYGTCPSRFNESLFESKRDRMQYEKASRLFLYKSRFVPFLISNFSVDTKKWIGEMITDRACVERALDYRRYITNFWISFENDLGVLIPYSKYDTIDKYFQAEPTKHINAMVRKEISPITCAMIHCRYGDKWYKDSSPYKMVLNTYCKPLERMVELLPQNPRNSDSCSKMIDDVFNVVLQQKY